MLISCTYVAPLSVALLPTIVTATVELCNVTLQWDPPNKLNEITCTPPSPGCDECTASPCTITGLNPSTEYEFAVTVNSGGCRASMNSTTARTMGEIKFVMGACTYVVHVCSVLA